MNLLERIDAAGSRLKPLALDAKDKSAALASESGGRLKSILYASEACALFTLFMLYRAYRGFFVLLPAVFRRVYVQMEGAVQAPFVDESELAEDGRDLDPETGRTRMRTRVTVAALSAVVTVSYVIAGVWKVVAKFAGTMLGTSSAGKSFEAAAEEVLSTEDQIKKMTEKGRKVNGEK